jgi:hypothetical protein
MHLVRVEFIVLESVWTAKNPAGSVPALDGNLLNCIAAPRSQTRREATPTGTPTSPALTSACAQAARSFLVSFGLADGVLVGETAIWAVPWQLR